MKVFKAPRVSVLLITYNQDRYAREAIRSVLNQDNLDFELIVCDDGSSDQTEEVLEDELSRSTLCIPVKKSYSRENRGLIANFNEGLAMCSGEYIILMAGDDVSLPGRVGACIQAFDENSNCMLVLASWECIDEFGAYGVSRSFEDRQFCYSKTSPRQSIYAKAAVCGAAAAYRRELFDFFGPLHAGAYGEDNCYWIRALLLGSIRTLSDELILWRRHSGSLSSLICGSAEESQSDLVCEKKGSLYKYLIFLKKHEKIHKQWLTDVDVAWKAGSLDVKLYKELQGTCFFKCEINRLKRYSLSHVPFSLWFKCMLRLLPYCDSYDRLRLVFIRYFTLRISSKRKLKYLSKKGIFLE